LAFLCNCFLSSSTFAELFSRPARPRLYHSFGIVLPFHLYISMDYRWVLTTAKDKQHPAEYSHFILTAPH
jgi:hypothetical protein